MSTTDLDDAPTTLFQHVRMLTIGETMEAHDPVALLRRALGPAAVRAVTANITDGGAVPLVLIATEEGSYCLAFEARGEGVALTWNRPEDRARILMHATTYPLAGPEHDDVTLVRELLQNDRTFDDYATDSHSLHLVRTILDLAAPPARHAMEEAITLNDPDLLGQLEHEPFWQSHYWNPARMQTPTRLQGHPGLLRALRQGTLADLYAADDATTLFARILGPSATCAEYTGEGEDGEPVPCVLLAWQDTWHMFRFQDFDDYGWDHPEARIGLILDELAWPTFSPVPMGADGALRLAEDLASIDLDELEEFGFDSWIPGTFLRLLFQQATDRERKAIRLLLGLRVPLVAAHLE